MIQDAVCVDKAFDSRAKAEEGFVTMIKPTAFDAYTVGEIALAGLGG